MQLSHLISSPAVLRGHYKEAACVKPGDIWGLLQDPLLKNSQLTHFTRLPEIPAKFVPPPHSHPVSNSEDKR